MTRDVAAETGSVIELGPGTGVFTAELLRRGVAEQDITLVELNPRFAKLLRRRFAKAQIMEMNAAKLYTTPLLTAPRVGAVLSGLGLPAMSTEQVTNILLGVFRYLKPGGAMYQFTYGPRCPVPAAILESLNLEAKRMGGTLFNLPPATVYRITVRQTALSSIRYAGDR